MKYCANCVFISVNFEALVVLNKFCAYWFCYIGKFGSFTIVE